MFEFIDHTADVAVRLTSPTEVELFRDASHALLGVLLEEPGAVVAGSDGIPIRLEAEDGESLLVDFLNELVFLFDTRGFLTKDAEFVEIRLAAPARLSATLVGEAFDPDRHRPKTEVKAATFHDLVIRSSTSGLTARVVFDL